MRTLIRIVGCCLLAATALYAQRGMGHGGGFHGGGGGFHGGGGGFRGGGGGFRGGFGGFRGNRIVVNRGFGFGGSWGWPGWGWGWPATYWPGDYGYGYGYGNGGYPVYYNAPSPNVTVVYPAQPAAVPVYSDSAPTVVQGYDEYGQQVAPAWDYRAGSPVYLIALKNHVIYAANSYSIKGDTLYFVTLQRESKSTPLIMVDRDLSARLNRERHVNFQVP